MTEPTDPPITGETIEGKTLVGCTLISAHIESAPTDPVKLSLIQEIEAACTDHFPNGSTKSISRLDAERIAQRLKHRFNERESSAPKLPEDMNKLERASLNRLRELTQHGYKTIDIKVRKDGKETWFEGDFLSGTRVKPTTV